MATVMAITPLAPRPSPHSIDGWMAPKLSPGKENQPTSKQQDSTRQTTGSRGRRERPCDGCRRRKSKCVLQDNRKCVLCEFHKQDCTFVEEAQPRKRKIDDSTIAKSTTSPKRIGIDTRDSSPKQVSVTQTRQSKHTGAAQQIPPSVVDESLSLQRHRHCRYVGQTTTLDTSILGLANFTAANDSQSELGKFRKVAENEYFNTYDDSDVPVPDDESRALAEIDQIVSPHGPALIDIYFRNVHPSFPIIQKRTFLDRQKNNDMQFNPPLLAAMYLLAISWWSQEPSVANFTPPDVARLEYLAITSLTMAMQRPKMSAVQAGLLLLQRPKSQTWTLTVQLIALGQEIGLHLDCSAWSIPVWEKRLRRRLAWALYMQDKWCAVISGRPSHVFSADWNVPQPSIDDFDESLSSESTTNNTINDDDDTILGRTIFMQMIYLTNIIAEVCQTFYSESAKQDFANAGSAAPKLVLARAKPVQIKLKEWFSQLPAECKMDNWTPGRSCATGYLHLAYFAAEISIHRRIVSSLDASSQDQYLLYICRSAAKTRLISAMDVVNRLKPEHLSAFWYFPSASNFALIGTFGALLQATSPGHEEAMFYAARLNEYAWTLRVSASRALWIQSAVDVLEANASMLTNLPAKPFTGQDDSSNNLIRRDSHTDGNADD